MTPEMEVEITQRFQLIQTQLDEMKETLQFIKETIVKADTTITKVANEVQPTIDGLLKSPMLKMLMPKERK